VLNGRCRGPTLTVAYPESRLSAAQRRVLARGREGLFSIPPENGRNYSQHLDTYKDTLAELIKRENIHTVLFAYASAAIILGVELAEEHGVRTFDLGSTLRGMCNGAMPGYHNFKAFITCFITICRWRRFSPR
jgi:hypothetical protein